MNRAGLHYSHFWQFSEDASPENQRLAPQNIFNCPRIRQVGLTPWQVLTHPFGCAQGHPLRAIVMVDVEFDTRDGRRLVLPRITEPEKEQAALLLALGWRLPEQPPPRIRAAAPPEA